MKVSSIDRQMGMLACPDGWIFDDQDGMSKQGDSPDCEYRRRLREQLAAEQSTFMDVGALRQQRMRFHIKIWFLL